MKKLFYVLSSTVAMIMFLGFSVGVVQAGPCELPDFASAVFSDPLTIDNPYMTWEIGTTFVYEPVPNDDNVVNYVEVTDQSITITVEIAPGMMKSVECRQVHDWVVVDEGTPNEFTSEDTLDWYAQDDAGNVWYCGEDTEEYVPGEEPDTSGSWTAGEDVADIGEIALPGIIMPANLKSGECDYQEFYEGEAEDWGKVMRLNATVTLKNEGDLGGTSYEDCLETKEGSTSELGDIEQKLYAEDIGLVLNFEHHGKRVRWELISVTP